MTATILLPSGTTISASALDRVCAQPVRPFVPPTTTPEHAKFIADAMDDNRDVFINGWDGKNYRCRIVDVLDGSVKVENYTQELPFLHVGAGGEPVRLNIEWVHPNRIQAAPMETYGECTCPDVMREGDSVCPACRKILDELEMPL